MSETKFTPGPWQRVGWKPVGIYGPGDLATAERICRTDERLEHDANAHLIAAAPDLYATLRGMFCPRPCNGRPDDLDVGDCFDAGECGCIAGVALSKARGEAS